MYAIQYAHWQTNACCVHCLTELHRNLRTCRIIFQSFFEEVCEKVEIPVIKRQALNRQN